MIELYHQVGGPRLMVRRPEDSSAVTQALAQGIIQVVEASGVSSAHITFNQRDEWEKPELTTSGWLQRSGIQYHWENRGYASFEEFLATLKNSKRKNIRQVSCQAPHWQQMWLQTSLINLTVFLAFCCNSVRVLIKEFLQGGGRQRPSGVLKIYLHLLVFSINAVSLWSKMLVSIYSSYCIST
jgi:hypothetical protein